MKIVSIVGARPQFIKSAPVSKEFFEKGIKEIIIHTGQHFDNEMSDIFFNQLKIPKPNYFLNINSLNHGAMTGRMIEEIEKILLIEKPDYVLVYGDTNSTLAGALAASKLNIKIIHIEAGLRSNNMLMPEEINRIITDRLSFYLFCPTDNAINNLQKEGYLNFNCRIIKNGDVMQDAAMMFMKYSLKPDTDIPDDFILCTLHRQENIKNESRLKGILSAIEKISEEKKVVLPIHPHTKKMLSVYNISLQNIIIIKPVGYLQMLYLLKNCSLVMTDSGGLQKEAFFCNKICMTLRDETEWIELVELGFNFIATTDTAKIIKVYKNLNSTNRDFNIDLFGKGTASKKVVKELMN